MQRQYFNADASANELGVYRFVTGWVQCFPEADTPWPGHLVKEVHEFDPSFRLMWAVNVWKTPNDGIRKTGNFMLARQVVNPRNASKWIDKPALPSTSVAGVTYRPPFLSAQILDARTDEDYRKGRLPKYEPFTGRHVETMRAAMWIRNNRNPDDVQAEVERTAAETQMKAERAIDKEIAYRKQNERQNSHRATGVGTVDRVYVSDTLKQLREAAGVNKEAAA